MIVESASKGLPMFVTRRFALLGAAGVVLSACVGASFRTDYDPLPASLAQAWRLADVRVTVPRSLSVSEAKTLLPDADIANAHASIRNRIVNGRIPAAVPADRRRCVRHPRPVAR